MLAKSYETLLINALVALLEKYQKRIHDNHGTAHEHVSSEQATQVLGTAVSIGATIGTVIPIPIVGTAIGATAGGIAGATTLGVIEISHLRKNKKIDNAVNVLGFFGSDEARRRSLIQQTARTVIKQREDVLERLKDTEKNRALVVAYLATNMMAAIKHRSDSSLLSEAEVMTQGLREVRSKKIHSQFLETLDGSEVTTKQIAQLKH